MPAKASLLLFFMFVIRLAASGQTIRGEVVDNEDRKQPIADVTIENIYTSLSISTSNTGAFIIAAASGQLLEFKKEGYKTVRVRIPQGYVPSYFRIMMKKGFAELKNPQIAQGNRYNYSSDSTRFHDLYKHELDFPKMSGMDMIASPFSALSGKNREIWRFQEDYEQFEQEKYVDKTFNEAVVTKYTGLTGDSLHYFMRRFRPSYEQLRNMNDYAFFNFIKMGAYHYRNSARQSNPR